MNCPTNKNRMHSSSSSNIDSHASTLLLQQQQQQQFINMIIVLPPCVPPTNVSPIRPLSQRMRSRLPHLLLFLFTSLLKSTVSLSPCAGCNSPNVFWNTLAFCAAMFALILLDLLVRNRLIVATAKNRARIWRSIALAITVLSTVSIASFLMAQLPLGAFTMNEPPSSSLAVHQLRPVSAMAVFLIALCSITLGIIVQLMIHRSRRRPHSTAAPRPPV